MSLTPFYTTAFKKDFKRLEKVHHVITQILAGTPLDDVKQRLGIGLPIPDTLRRVYPRIFTQMKYDIMILERGVIWSRS
jgi:hypothetical protein